MKKVLLFLTGLMITAGSVAQFNITITNPEAIEVLKGNYDPAAYTPGVVINDPDSILQAVVNKVSKDTMIAYLQHIDARAYATQRATHPAWTIMVRELCW